MSNTDLIVAITAIFLLAGCEEDKCNRPVTDSKNYQAAFDHCMDKAAAVSKSGTHDNYYNTVEECQRYAVRVDTAQCLEGKK